MTTPADTPADSGATGTGDVGGHREIEDGEQDGTATVMGRMLAAGISRRRAEGHLAAGSIYLDGRQVHDPATPAPQSTNRITINPQ